MRYVIVILALILVVGGLGGIKAAQINTLIGFGQTMQQMGPPPEAVNARAAEEQAWEGLLTAVASVVTVQGVTLSNDAAGIVSKILFESGQMAKAGQTLVELDASVERAQVASLRARLKLADQTVQRSRALLPTGAIPQSQLDADESAYHSLRADINALEAQIDRKQVRAPFAGRLGIRGVNLGQYLSPGSPITVLDSADNVFVDFTFPQDELSRIKVGMPVRVTLRTGGDPLGQGTITAVDPALDTATRALKVRASVQNGKGSLRPGMFVNVAVELPDRDKVVVVPATAVVHASYGDSVFIVEPKLDEQGQPAAGPDGKPAKISRQQFVRLGPMRGDFVAVLDGVKAGQQVVTAGAFKLRNGSPIEVKAEALLDPKLDPRPQNR